MTTEEMANCSGEVTVYADGSQIWRSTGLPEKWLAVWADGTPLKGEGPDGFECRSYFDSFAEAEQALREGGEGPAAIPSCPPADPRVIETANQTEALKAENKKLRRALLRAIPWIGARPEGPDWATPEAKARNKAMCEEAFDEAAAFFPDGLVAPEAE